MYKQSETEITNPILARLYGSYQSDLQGNKCNYTYHRVTASDRLLYSAMKPLIAAPGFSHKSLPGIQSLCLSEVM